VPQLPFRGPFHDRQIGSEVDPCGRVPRPRFQVETLSGRQPLPPTPFTGAATCGEATSDTGGFAVSFKLRDALREVSHFFRDVAKLSEEVSRVFPAENGIGVNGVWVFGHRRYY
jgi:hypothetical protein